MGSVGDKATNRQLGTADETTLRDQGSPSCIDRPPNLREAKWRYQAKSGRKRKRLHTREAVGRQIVVR